MPLTNFPQGVASFGMPIMSSGGPLGVTTTGNVFFVYSGSGKDQKADQSGQGTTTTQPFKTLNYAVTQCKPSNGDCIYVMPGHVETITAAGGLTFGVAGVRVIGLGVRQSRPQLSLGVAGATIPVTATSVYLQNMVVVAASTSAVLSCFQLSGAFGILDTIDFVETPTKQLVQFALVTGTDCQIINCTHHQATAPTQNQLWIQGQACDRLMIENNLIMITTTNNASSSLIETDTTAPHDIQILSNTLVQLGGALTIPINLMAATSGYVAYNDIASAKTAIAGSASIASCYACQNFASHTVNKSGILEPVTDA